MSGKRIKLREDLGTVTRRLQKLGDSVIL